MQIKVTLDMRNTLVRSKEVRFRNGLVVLVSFKYEWLGLFYYRCGELNHIDSGYDLDAEDVA